MKKVYNESEFNSIMSELCKVSKFMWDKSGENVSDIKSIESYVYRGKKMLRVKTSKSDFNLGCK